VRHAALQVIKPTNTMQVATSGIAVEYLNKIRLNAYLNTSESAVVNSKKRNPYLSFFKVTTENDSGKTKTILVNKAEVLADSAALRVYVYDSFADSFPSYDYASIKYLPLLFYQLNGEKRRLADVIPVHTAGKCIFFLVTSAVPENTSEVKISLPVIETEDSSSTNFVMFFFTNYLIRSRVL